MRFVILIVFLFCQSAFAGNILVAGDSVSLGYTPYIQEKIPNVSHVGACWFDQGPTTRNLSNAGNSRRLADCLPVWLARGSYSVVVFNAGLHDVAIPGCKNGNTAHEVELSDSLANLQRALDEVRSYGAIPVFITTTPVVGMVACHSESDIAAYNSAEAAMMRSQGVLIIPISSYIYDRQVELHGSHGIHFTQEGYRVIADYVVAFLKYHGLRG